MQSLEGAAADARMRVQQLSAERVDRSIEARKHRDVRGSELARSKAMTAYSFRIEFGSLRHKTLCICTEICEQE